MFRVGRERVELAEISLYCIAFMIPGMVFGMDGLYGLFIIFVWNINISIESYPTTTTTTSSSHFNVKCTNPALLSVSERLSNGRLAWSCDQNKYNREIMNIFGKWSYENYRCMIWLGIIKQNSIWQMILWTPLYVEDTLHVILSTRQKTYKWLLVATLHAKLWSEGDWI